MRSTLKFLIIAFVIAFAGLSHADTQRGIRNYQAIMAGQKKVEQLSPQELLEVLAVHTPLPSRQRRLFNRANSALIVSDPVFWN